MKSGVLAVCLTLAALSLSAPATAQDNPCAGPHDTPETACALGGDAMVQEPIAGAGERNAYRFDVASPGARVQLDLTDLPGDYDLYLVDSDRNIVDQSVQEGTTPRNLDVTLDSAGTFFVYVLADPGRAVAANAPYTMRLNVGAPLAAEASGPSLAPAPPEPLSNAMRFTLLRSDDFSDPIHGLFLDRQRGTNQSSGNRYEWEYGYVGGALRGFITGSTTESISMSWSPLALGKVSGDFAVEVRARATAGAPKAVYSLIYTPSQGEGQYFFVEPGPRQYGFWQQKERRTLISGRDPAINPGSEDNVLRLEMEGSAVSLFANGTKLDQVPRVGDGSARADLALEFGARGPTQQGVEVQFRDFRVYALGS